MIKCARHPYCDNEFEESRGGKMFCSRRCANIHYNEKMKRDNPLEYAAMRKKKIAALDQRAKEDPAWKKACLFKQASRKYLAGKLPPWMFD